MAETETGWHAAWRGGVNVWECDEMGHLNTRFYVQKAMEALPLLFARLGLPGRFAPAAPATLRPREMHIRFHRESPAATPLAMQGAVTAIREGEIDVVLVMTGIEDATPKATFRMTLAHVDDADRPQPWPAGFAEALEGQAVALPEAARPRSTGAGPVESDASMQRAEALGLACIAAGSIGPERLDAFGRMAPQHFIGAVSDGIRSLTLGYREIVLAHSDAPPARCGGAVLEFRILHLDWPRAGDCYEVRSGLARVEGKVKSLVHWMLDPVTGRPWGTMESIAVDFDLDRRRIVEMTAPAREALAPHLVPGLAL